MEQIGPGLHQASGLCIAGSAMPILALADKLVQVLERVKTFLSFEPAWFYAIELELFYRAHQALISFFKAFIQIMVKCATHTNETANTS